MRMGRRGITDDVVADDKSGTRPAPFSASLTGHAREIHDVELEQDFLAKVAPAFLVGGTAEAIMGWLNGNVDTTLERLIDDLTTLWLITGNGAADHASQRFEQRKDR
jgi:hypothetical protein